MANQNSERDDRDEVDKWSDDVFDSVDNLIHGYPSQKDDKDDDD